MTEMPITQQLSRLHCLNDIEKYLNWVDESVTNPNDKITFLREMITSEKKHTIEKLLEISKPAE